MTQPFTDAWMQWESYQVTNFSRVFQMPAWAPDPCYIVRADMLLEGTIVFNGRPLLLHDPGGIYIKGAWGQSLPAGQTTELPYFAPASNFGLRRLVVVDLHLNQTSMSWRYANAPIRHSRSEGDFIMLDKATQPSAWFAHTIFWFNPASIGETMPPAHSLGQPFAYGTGSWAMTGNGSSPVGSGRTIVKDNSARGNLLFGFTAPADGEISMLQFRVDTLNAKGNVTFQLYSDVAGLVGMPIGIPSWPWFVGAGGEQMPQFPIGCGANTIQGNRYWLVGTPDATLSMDVDTHAGLPSNNYTSGRSDTIVGAGNNLPNGEIFRMLVCAITKSV